MSTCVLFARLGYRLSVGIGTAGVICGCATMDNRLSPEARHALMTAEHVEVVRMSGVDFVAFESAKTAGSGLLGLVVGPEVARSLAVQDGQRMTQEYELVDPAVGVRDGMATVLRNDLGISKARIVDDSSERTEGVELTLAVQTTNWQLIYYVSNWNRYQLYYNATASLSRTSDSVVLWTGGCQLQDDDPRTSPTLDELQANHGEALRAKLVSTSSACILQLKAQLLSTKP